MALKDEPSPKCTFPGAETSLLKSYKKLAVGAEITVSHFPLFKSRCHWPRPLLWLLPQLPAAKQAACSCWACCCCWWWCCCCCWWCLTVPSEPTRNQLQSAAPMPSKQLHNKVLAGGRETAKHHGPEGRNDLQKHAAPGLDVPSGFW